MTKTMRKTMERVYFLISEKQTYNIAGNVLNTMDISGSIWVFPKCAQNYKRLFKLATSCIRYRDVTIAPVRHR